MSLRFVKIYICYILIFYNSYVSCINVRTPIQKVIAKEWRVQSNYM